MNTQNKGRMKMNLWILSRLISRRKNYAFFGDIEELYRMQIKDRGRSRAGLWLWAQILRSVPHALYDSLYWSGVMFRSYLKITYRNFRRHKSYSLINIMGLAVGMACCIMILSYVRYELSYDKYHTHADQIHRLTMAGTMGKMSGDLACGNGAVAKDLIREIPEVRNAVRFRYIYHNRVRCGDKLFFEDGVYLADASVFEVFSFPLLSGDPASALADPFNVVISESTAQRYFGNHDPMGKILRFDDQSDFHITGVMEDIPSNSHFTFDMLISFSTFERENPQLFSRWMGDFNNYTYLLLEPGTDPRTLDDRFDDMIEKRMGTILKAIGGDIRFVLQPLASIHLHSHLNGEAGANSHISSIYLFSSTAFFILLLACINFMNLATARSTNRAREVGIRKIHGAHKGKLAQQFLGESLIYSFVSLGAAVILVELFLPMFRALSGRDIRVGYASIPWMIPVLIGFGLFVGLSAGSYPALVLSRFKASRVLKGIWEGASGKGRFRKILVTFQFAVSIILLIGTGVIYHQVHFMKNKRLGFDKEHMLVIRGERPDVRLKLKPLINGLQGIPEVAAVSTASHVPGWGARRNIVLPEGFSLDETQMMAFTNIGYDYLDTLGIELKSGRNFSPEFTSDPQKSVLINEAAAAAFGWEDPVGKNIRELDGRSRPKTVIGVFKDYHFMSVQHSIEPQCLYCVPDESETIVVRMKPGAVSAALNAVQSYWKSMVPDAPFDYFFLDQSLNDRYHEEERLSRIVTNFSVLAIFIACLGLFGMVSYAAEKRTREIGIRRVLGASASQIVTLLSRDFLQWVIIANVIAWPAAYFAVTVWLRRFPYHVRPDILIFAGAGGVALIIALLTMGIKAFQAAAADPVESLKYE